MSGLFTFDFERLPIRFAVVNGREAAVGVDIARALGITNQRDVFVRTPEDEKGVATIDTLGGSQELIVLYEPGIWRLIFQSRKPQAERLKSWVFNTVLPEIRRTGSFAGSNANVKPELGDVLSLARACELVRRTHGQAAARHLWMEMGGLPLPADAEGVVRRHPIASRRPVNPAKAKRDARHVQAVHLFVDECCLLATDCEVQARPLYLAYRAWEKRRRGLPMSITRFGRVMPMAGFQKDKARMVFYLGLRVREDA